MRIRSGTKLFAALLLALTALGVARADEDDPPGRAARLSDIEGSVSLQPGGAGEWAAAVLNRPLTTGDRVWADANSRAELDLGAAVMRLGPGTGCAFLNLDDNTAQMQLSAGTLIVRLRDLQPGQTYEVDTPNLALLLQQPGEYRIEASESGDVTVVKVSQGAAQASGAGQTVAIGPQQAVTFSGTDNLAYGGGTLGAPDDLDAWSAARERQVEDSASREYVADGIAGTQDLDNNGTWTSTPDYGYVWVPATVAVGWAPYRFGQWLWVAPWGWTWVDQAPWGYAPFHYGRWVRYRGDWCWVPGPRRGRPVYAPALVGWVGGEAVVGAAPAGGGVGWFPLGPREVYVPPYRVSQGYVRRVNITNTTIVNNLYITNVYEHNLRPLHYVNNTVAAVTVVPQGVFTSGQRLGGHTLRLPQAALEGAEVSAAAPAIAPNRQSVLGPVPARAPVRPPAAILNRPVMARTPPPRAAAPLERQIEAVQANGGRPLPRAELSRLQPASSAGTVRLVAPAGPVVNAAALPRGNPGRAVATPPRPASPAQAAPPGLIERERTLQNNRVTDTPRLPNYAPPRAVREESAAPAANAPLATHADPAPHDVRPMLAPEPQRAPAPDTPPRAPPSTAVPVYRPPGAAPAPAGRPALTEEMRSRTPVTAPPRIAPAPVPAASPRITPAPLPAASPRITPAPLPAAPPRIAPSASPPAGASRASDPDPRGTAAHGDRSSRDRATRDR